jgi:hypothetical protein
MSGSNTRHRPVLDLLNDTRRSSTELNISSSTDHPSALAKPCFTRMHAHGCKSTRADNELSHVSIFRLSILRVVCFYICFMIIRSFHGDGTDSILWSHRAGGKTLSVGDHNDTKFGTEGWICTDSEETMHRQDIELRQATREPFEPSSEPSASRLNHVHLLGHNDDDPSSPTS